MIGNTILIEGAKFLFNEEVVTVHKITATRVYFMKPDGGKPSFVNTDTFLSRAEVLATCGTATARFSCATPNFTEVPSNDLSEKVFVAGRQCGKSTMVAELTEKWVKKFKKDLRYGSRKAKNEARRALRA